MLKIFFVFNFWLKILLFCEHISETSLHQTLFFKSSLPTRLFLCFFIPIPRREIFGYIYIYTYIIIVFSTILFASRTTYEYIYMNIQCLLILFNQICMVQCIFFIRNKIANLCLQNTLASSQFLDCSLKAVFVIE